MRNKKQGGLLIRIRSLFHYIDERLVLDDRKFKMGVVVVLLWFLYQLFFFAVNIKVGIVPDEAYHISMIQYYAHEHDLSPFITKQVDHFDLGDITRVPSYLYYYEMGLFEKIPIVDHLGLKFLRLVSIICSFGTVLIFIKILGKLTKDNWVKLISIFMLTNTLMVIFLGMGVTYDNMVNLLSMLSIYLLYRIIKEGKIQHVYLFIITGLLASITKFTFIPLFVIEGGIIFLSQVGKWKTNLKNYIQQARKLSTVTVIWAGILFFFSIFLFAERYGYNFLKYHAITPSCDQIHTVSECISDPQYTLVQQLKEEAGTKEQIGIFPYAEKWKNLIVDRTLGVFGHRYLPSNPVLYTSFYLFIYIGLIFLIRKMNLKRERLNLYLLILSLLYIFMLFYFVNYADQKRYGVLGVAVQGRYLFPVFPIALYLLNYYILKFLKYNSIKLLYFCVILVLFIHGGLWWFLRVADENWYKAGQPSFTYIIKSD